MLDANHINIYDGLTNTANNATYEVLMPSDYLHILNCICIYDIRKTYKCYNAGTTWRASATRLTADMYSQVLDNFWNKPTYYNPYYYIHNTNT
jgi:sulfur relay (sulfurtransferase) DsrF/TusC family protein